MRTVHWQGRALRLRKADLLATGGEGTLWAIGASVYKVWHDPDRVPCATRLTALRATSHPGVVLPEGHLLDGDGRPVGVRMPRMQGWPLVRLTSASFRARLGVTDDDLVRLVYRMRDDLGAIHSAGLTVVDLTLANLLASDDLAHLWWIDTTSWATPTHPATAQTDAIRDRHATALGPQTDWFAFAVSAFQLLVGAHPYRGHHPSLSGLDARMTANASALRPEVTLPPHCRPRSVLPWPAWFHAVLEEGHRGPPPTSTAARLASPPRARAAEVDGQPIEVTLRDHTVRLGGPDGPIPCLQRADAIALHRGRILAMSGPRLMTLVVRRVGSRWICAPRVLGAANPGTLLLPGVAVQPMPTGRHLLLLPPTGGCHRVPVPALAGTRVLDGGLDGRTVYLDIERHGHPVRLLFRFDLQWRCVDQSEGPIPP